MHKTTIRYPSKSAVSVSCIHIKNSWNSFDQRTIQFEDGKETPWIVDESTIMLLSREWEKKKTDDCTYWKCKEVIRQRKTSISH